MSSNDCFAEKELLPLNEGCNENLKGADCASGYCSPISKTCGEIITPTAPAGGGEKLEPLTLPNFLFTEDPNDVIGRVIEFVIGLAGTAALVMFIYGGVRWLTSGGDAEGIKKGREAMQWAAIGLIIVFSSFVLVKFVLKVIGSTAGA
ncbi:MAG: pilin [Patescibacteria group bacterium]